MIFRPRVFPTTITILVIDLLSIGLVIIYVGLPAMLSYSGKCPSLVDGPATDCSVIGAVLGAVFYLILFSLVFYWWIVIPVIILPLIIGIAVDIYRKPANQNQ